MKVVRENERDHGTHAATTFDDGIMEISPLAGKPVKPSKSNGINVQISKGILEYFLVKPQGTH